MPLSIGDRRGPYEVISPLGEVAWVRCGRRATPGSIAPVAWMNHPNICTLHDVGPNYLVMELVEGERDASRGDRVRARRPTQPLDPKTLLRCGSRCCGSWDPPELHHREVRPTRHPCRTGRTARGGNIRGAGTT